MRAGHGGRARHLGDALLRSLGKLVTVACVARRGWAIEHSRWAHGYARACVEADPLVWPPMRASSLAARGRARRRLLERDGCRWSCQVRGYKKKALFPELSAPSTVKCPVPQLSCTRLMDAVIICRPSLLKFGACRQLCVGCAGWMRPGGRARTYIQSGMSKKQFFRAAPQQKSARSALQGAAGALRGAQRRRRRRTAGARN